MPHEEMLIKLTNNKELSNKECLLFKSVKQFFNEDYNIHIYRTSMYLIMFVFKLYTYRNKVYVTAYNDRSN